MPIDPLFCPVPFGSLRTNRLEVIEGSLRARIPVAALSMDFEMPLERNGFEISDSVVERVSVRVVYDVPFRYGPVLGLPYLDMKRTYSSENVGGTGRKVAPMVPLLGVGIAPEGDSVKHNNVDGVGRSSWHTRIVSEYANESSRTNSILS